MTVCFDGSFEGFLCAVAACLASGEKRPVFVPDGDAPVATLFAGEVHAITTALDTALTFRKRFIRAASQEAFATARYAFHSRKNGIEELVWLYLTLGLKMGRQLQGMLAQEPVCSVNRIARQVAHEAHKFKGFVRFQAVEAGFLYSRIEPVADIVTLIAPHFVQRVGDQPWMIHDVRRNLAALYDLKSWQLIRNIELTGEPHCTVSEHEYAALWQRYFQHHAIAERHNPKLQQQHVPLRYRKHLPEFAFGTDTGTLRGGPGNNDSAGDNK